MFWIGLGVGVVCGGVIGMFIMSFCVIAGREE